jgi:hypothetical protein
LQVLRLGSRVRRGKVNASATLLKASVICKGKNRGCLRWSVVREAGVSEEGGNERIPFELGGEGFDAALLANLLGKEVTIQAVVDEDILDAVVVHRNAFVFDKGPELEMVVEDIPKSQ